MKQRRVVSVGFGVLLVFLVAAVADAQEKEDYFRQNCAGCHTIGGGRLIGPDLKNVSERKDREWLTKFILNPKAVLDAKDPYAMKLKEESKGMIMTNSPGMTRKRAESLLDLIHAESKLEQSKFVGMSLSMEPFTTEDIKKGENIFLGRIPLDAGGPACVGCHTVPNLSEIAGGSLGPELSQVYEDYGGRKELGAWLFAPATTTMKPLFAKKQMTQEEIHALLAFLDASAKAEQKDDGAPRVLFLLIGWGGAILLLLLIDAIWKNRLRSVRRFLVYGDPS